jgi:deferrochelatase/peroxidase EfeB
MSGCPFSPTRRGVLGAAAGLAGAIGGLRLARGEAAQAGMGQPPLTRTAALTTDRILPFHGAHQNGIATPMQGHTYFAAFDIVTDKRSEVIALLQRWTEAAAALAEARPLPGATAPDAPPADSGDVLGLAPSRLTLTFGFGPGLFGKDGVDRFGLAQHRPAAFVDLPRFVGDQLVPERTGGDLSVQACGDDQQACMSAVRQLMRLAYGAATVRWVQAGFLAGYDPKVTPRNLMGFKDGTFNVAVDNDADMDKHIWVGEEGGWMRGGSYLVARPIRIALEHWDRMKLAFQEQTVGRTKLEGAPIGKAHEFDALDLDATDHDGNPLIAENAHVRLAAPQSNGGATILRRGYSYDNGVSMVAERWPPWRHAMELDAGLLFICYQRDPRTGFIRIFDRMSKFDMLNQFVTHIGGGMFACPGGVQAGQFVGQALFDA